VTEQPVTDVPFSETPVFDDLPSVEPVEVPATDPIIEPAIEVPAVDVPAADLPAIDIPMEDPPTVDIPAVEPISRRDVPVLRRWTDISGRYHVDARFVETRDNVVRLQLADGRYVRIEREKLSLNDRQVIDARFATVAKAW